jgi:methyltransferase
MTPAPSWLFPLVLLALAFLPMAIEARRSKANERALRAAGAIEPRGDVYAVMQVAYPACFLAIILDAWVRGRMPTVTSFVPGLVVFACAKGLKYWAIATLGPRWTFRVLVPPGSPRTTAGPYRRVRHPNYLAVAGELAGMAVMAQAPVAGFASVVSFGALMLARIRIEERALASAQAQPSAAASEGSRNSAL